MKVKKNDVIIQIFLLEIKQLKREVEGLKNKLAEKEHFTGIARNSSCSWFYFFF